MSESARDITAGPAPRVSIVIPAYRAAAFIGVALAAAAGQTVQDYEIIVVDDASPDDTAAVVEAAARADPRIRLGRLAQNGGPGAARNRALDMARGAWICLLDADDGMHPQRLERLLALAEAHGADFVSDNLLLQPADGGPALPMVSPDAFGPERRMGFAEFVDGNISTPWAWLRAWRTRGPRSSSLASPIQPPHLRTSRRCPRALTGGAFRAHRSAGCARSSADGRWSPSATPPRPSLAP